MPNIFWLEGQQHTPGIVVSGFTELSALHQHLKMGVHMVIMMIPQELDAVKLCEASRKLHASGATFMFVADYSTNQRYDKKTVHEDLALYWVTYAGILRDCLQNDYSYLQTAAEIITDISMGKREPYYLSRRLEY